MTLNAMPKHCPCAYAYKHTSRQCQAVVCSQVEYKPWNQTRSGCCLAQGRSAAAHFSQSPCSQQNSQAFRCLDHPLGGTLISKSCSLHQQHWTEKKIEREREKDFKTIKTHNKLIVFHVVVLHVEQMFLQVAVLRFQQILLILQGMICRSQAAVLVFHSRQNALHFLVRLCLLARGNLLPNTDAESFEVAQRGAASASKKLPSCG